MKSVAAEPLGRERSPRAVVVATALLLAALGALAWFVLGGWAPAPPASVVEPRTTAAATAASAESEAQAAREIAGAQGEEEPEPLFLCTFLDGAPVSALVEDVRTVARHLPDWSAGISRHRVPATGDALAVLARDCIAVVVRRGELPSHGEHRVDLTRSPVLDVRLVNVPAGIRERLELRLQVEYGPLDPEENSASIGTDLRRPILMTEDRVLMPLVVQRPGKLVVHAGSRHSTHSYPSPKVPFEPVSQVIEIDCGVLSPACALADLTLTLRFPFAHPDSEMDLSLVDAAGWQMMHQRRARRCEGAALCISRPAARDGPPAPATPRGCIAADPPGADRPQRRQQGGRARRRRRELVAGRRRGPRRARRERCQHPTAHGTRGVALRELAARQ